MCNILYSSNLWHAIIKLSQSAVTIILQHKRVPYHENKINFLDTVPMSNIVHFCVSMHRPCLCQDYTRRLLYVCWLSNGRCRWQPQRLRL